MIGIGYRFLGVSIGVLILFSGGMHAIEMSDISSADPAYSAIRYSVKNGFLPLYSKNAFNPNQEITRREFAIGIEALMKQMRLKNQLLNEVELQELKYLAQSFKPTFTTLEVRMSHLEQLAKTSAISQAQLSEELSKTDYQINQKIKSLQTQSIILSVLLVISLVLGAS
jgi:hypothetical protein